MKPTEELDSIIDGVVRRNNPAEVARAIWVLESGLRILKEKQVEQDHKRKRRIDYEGL